MKEKIDALQRNNTWALVPADTTAKIIGNKWVYRVKYNLGDNISKYKACLVANGFRQTHRVDFFGIFSSVMKPCTFKVILSLAVMHH